jgi:predicted O-methyltransferase YrrM
MLQLKAQKLLRVLLRRKSDHVNHKDVVHLPKVNSKHPKSAILAQTLRKRDDKAFVFATRVKDAQKSMLAVETLAAIYNLACECGGPIIEIGAYIGGATLALLEATRKRRNTVVSVEFGVANDRPEISTKDSVADLQRNVESWGLADERHVVLPGWTLEAWLAGNILLELAGNRADLFVVDSDGFVERDFIYFHPLLNDGAILVFDDYWQPKAGGKSERIAPFVDDMLSRGVVSEIALLPWGTWFGQLIRRPRSEEIEPYRRKWRQEGWPWLDFLDQQRKAQHLPRAKELKARLLPFQFTDHKSNIEKGPEAYKGIRAI